jgi:acetylornithine/N-succinyldiaminopimelate aminotransferase
VGEELTRIAALDAAFHMPTYARKPVLFVHGEGMRLFDDEGREYLDFVAGIGSVNLGHSHPAVIEAVRDQIGRLTQVSNLYYVEHRDELAADLAVLFADDAAGAGPAGAAVRHAAAPTKVFFCNSGAEANEGAIKLARRWGKARRGDGCYRIVTAERSFHGRTLGALAATGQPSKQEAFAPLPEGFDHVPLNDLTALYAAVTADTCAVLLEPVQGEGGVYACDPGYLKAVRALCDERDVLLMLDEVQTGLYRTGPVFAHHAYGVRPDVMCLAKSLANGLPIGAIVAHGEAADAFSPGDHGSTFAGGPVVCAAARACLAALAGERLGANARASGAYLRSRLAALRDGGSSVTEVRGVGLMNAVELARPVAADAAAALLSRGLVVNSIGTTVLRMLPPLVCGKPEVDTLIDALYEVLQDVDGRRVGR